MHDDREEGLGSGGEASLPLSSILYSANRRELLDKIDGKSLKNVPIYLESSIFRDGVSERRRPDVSHSAVREVNRSLCVFHLHTSLISRFDTERARFYSAEIVCALKFLHRKGIVYRWFILTIKMF